MSQQLFRKKSLERLSTPERLDTLMQVTTPRAWLGLVGAALLVLAGLLWGIFGHTVEAVQGSGMLLRQGGLYSIEATAGGHVAEVLVAPGDRVRNGDLVARLHQPELAAEVAQVEAQIGDVRLRRGEMVGLAGQESASRLEALRGQRLGAERQYQAAHSRFRYLQDRLARERELAARGVIARAEPEATAEQAARAEAELLGAAAELERVEAEEAAARGSLLRTTFDLDQQLLALEHRLGLLRERYEQSASIRSLFDGHLVEMLVDRGELVAAGRPLFLVEQDDSPLEAVVFVPMEGKRIRPGMRVEVSPEGVRREEHGFIVGTVLAVSDVPVNPAAMNRFLRNEELVRQFNASGATYRVSVRLDASEGTPSGFRWSTRQGPELSFGSGTLLTGRVVVQQVAPLTLVIPTLRKWMRG
jgi:HlyD family secretion protein